MVVYLVEVDGLDDVDDHVNDVIRDQVDNSLRGRGRRRSTEEGRGSGRQVDNSLGGRRLE